MLHLTPKWVRLAPNRTNPGVYKITFLYILTRLIKLLLKSDQSRINLIWSQTDQSGTISESPAALLEEQTDPAMIGEINC